MKLALRVLLFIVALITGGLLGYYLLMGFEVFKVLLFYASCVILGEIFYKLDVKIMDIK